MPKDDDADGSLAVLAAASIVVGLVSGLIVAAFRITLDRADEWRAAALVWGHDLGILGLGAVVGGCAVVTGIAAWLVRRFAPYASGSGIPHAEAVVTGELPSAPFALLPVKFAGGVFAIGAGLALGREGPSVQMGATVAHLLGGVFRRSLTDCRVLLAAGAGAGLATAFNAPLAGSIFVLEELVRRYSVRASIATFGASAAAIAVGRLILRRGSEFDVPLLPHPGADSAAFFVVLGVIAGFLGILYNRTLLLALSTTDRLRQVPAEVLAAAVGGAVGLLAWFAPDAVGGGDAITQRALTGTATPALVAVAFAVRLVLGSVSYAARTPGGLFAPLLALGSLSGRLYGDIAGAWMPGAPADAQAAAALVGMSALFAAAVRSPVTGIVLVTEMTGSFTLLLPMVGACCAAMLIPTLLNNSPVYDSLRERLRPSP